MSPCGHILTQYEEQEGGRPDAEGNHLTWQYHLILVETSVLYEGRGDTQVSDGVSPGAAAKTGSPELRSRAYCGFALVAFASIVLIGTEIALVDR